MVLTPNLGSLYPSMEKLRHLGNSVTESARTTTAHNHVINIREHARHIHLNRYNTARWFTALTQRILYKGEI